ncbi:MAG: zinc ribbon domain-containing protein [Proteobacteria bacterium]|nr:zinc ribbon domain-containing protein [Pseudomonadota bacterium]
MWIVSIVLAGFLIGLGGLVIGDLPRVSSPVLVEQFVNPAESARITREQADIDSATATVATRLTESEQRLSNATNDVSTAQESFNTWIATRTATTDQAQDPEVIARTHGLEALRETERSAQQTRDDLVAEQRALQDREVANNRARAQMQAAALPAFERASFFQQLNVFALRLAFTLPLLLIAGLFLLRKKKGDYWPLQRGFILFAAYAFFVELVPYLPEYGGYVHYGVGILITLLVGHFVIRWMRNYLKTRAASETKAEDERRKSIAYDEALKKMAAHACPGCDRVLAASETPVDYCMHCGMHLFDRCPNCQARRFAFFRYCMACGAAAQGSQTQIKTA